MLRECLKDTFLHDVVIGDILLADEKALAPAEKEESSFDDFSDITIDEDEIPFD